MRFLFLISFFGLVACTTKQYPQMTPLSPLELRWLSCHEIAEKKAQLAVVQQEIEEIGEFDTQTVLGFFSDLGVGNSIAKHEAKKRLRIRLAQLNALFNERHCQY